MKGGNALSMAARKSFNQTRIGGIISCFTNISTATTAQASAPVTRPAGLRLSQNCCNRARTKPASGIRKRNSKCVSRKSKGAQKTSENLFLRKQRRKPGRKPRSDSGCQDGKNYEQTGFLINPRRRTMKRYDFVAIGGGNA